MDFVCVINFHGGLGDLWRVSFYIGIVGGEVGGSGIKRGYCGWDEENMVRLVFPVVPI